MFSVDFKYEDEMDQRHIKVLPDGHFSMAGLEDMQAEGMTVVELDSAITAHFGLDYRDPELSIIVEQIAAYQAYVLGEVKMPGLVQLPPAGAGVIQAVAMAGGFNEDASPSETVVLRVTPQGFLYRRCDLSHIEKHGFLSPDFLDLQPFDGVYVPKNAIGDLAQFTRQVIGSTLSFTSLFWDIYSIANIDEVTRIVR
jgi:polysaccharide export outer membrane protein